MPNRIFPREKVALVDVALPVTAQAQPTNQDVLNAIQDLSKKISQLSKNQQALENTQTCIADHTQYISSVTNAIYIILIQAFDITPS
jgi:hypothetical protein